MAEVSETRVEQLEQALNEYDMGYDLVSEEMDSADGNEWAQAYVAGMLEAAAEEYLKRVPASLRLEAVGEVQSMVLQMAIELAQEGA
ncbi:MAG: hypothetical protein RLZ51_1863 [Pseudomonadota bacterium]|jgi:hypothetical protein